MASKANRIFLILFFIFLMLITFPATIVLSDNPCPYPCYPSPPGIVGGTGTPSGVQPPPATLTPPYQGGYYPSPTGNLPNYYPPPYGNNLYSPPPPEPILPYFPFYFRKPPHQTGEPSPATIPGKSTVMTATTTLLVLVLVFL